MLEETTATAGADPVIDSTLTQIAPDSSPGDDAKVDSSTTKKEETLPWDKDPRWKSARTAEKNLSTLLEEHGFESMDDLKSALSNEQSIRDLLGGRDAKKVLEAAKTLEKYEEHWAAQKMKELEANEEPEETAERYKKEAKHAKAEIERIKNDFESVLGSQSAIKQFDSTVRSVVTDVGMSKAETEFANLFLGVNNPAATVNINDKKAVKEMAKSGVKQFQNFINQISQAAVDSYAAGKSTVTPITKAGGEATPATKKQELSKGASIDETFESARAEMLEMLKKATS